MSLLTDSPTRLVVPSLPPFLLSSSAPEPDEKQPAHPPRQNNRRQEVILSAVIYEINGYSRAERAGRKQRVRRWLLDELHRHHLAVYLKACDVDTSREMGYGELLSLCG